MSTPDPAKSADADAKPAAGTTGGKSGKAGVLLAVIVPIFSAGAAFAGSRAAASHAVAHPPEAPTVHVAPAKPPGPTMPLEPFLVTMSDANKKAHAMKVTIAVEFAFTAKEDVVKTYTPRIRDSVLTYLRGLSYEDATDPKAFETLRHEVLERCRTAGALDAERILITDLVLQ